MNGLKVGVLTFHSCINYGSYWQARCLVEGLQQRGYDAVILDHYSKRVNIAEWKCALQPVLPSYVSAADKIQYRKKIEKFFSCLQKLPLSERFPLEAIDKMSDYDVIVVGSDEVWNLFHPWYRKQPIFYGEGLKADKIISYSASFGNYPAIWGLEEEWSKKLLNFDSISVRDENSFCLVKSATGIEADVVLDPCLQFKMNIEQRALGVPSKFIAVYGHNFSPYFIQKVKQYARSEKLKLISIGYRNDWADEQWLDADPHDFALFMQQATSVATNFFHGCVFSLLNERPFVCETSPYRNNKVHGLMKLVGGESHLMQEDSIVGDYIAHLTQPIRRSIVEQINTLRQTSNAYLDNALGNQQLKVA
jgi:hypothetical protein